MQLLYRSVGSGPSAGTTGTCRRVPSGEALFDRAVDENEESFPIAVVDRIVAGESPIRVYREHRRMTQKEVAEAAGISPLYLSQIERATRTGSVATLAAIAKALDVELDELISD